MPDSFVHLHVHTEYSMLDGAAKIGPLFDEVVRLGMTAVAITDHGNMFGTHDFWDGARRAGVKPIIGIEAYIAPASRFHKKPVFWGNTDQRGDEYTDNGDVGGRGAYTHMTMLAANATGLQNLFTLHNRAWLEGKYHKARMDRELIAEHADGILATTGCLGSEVNTRLKLGQPAEALEAAAAYRDIFGAGNYYLELMDHDIALERSLRDDLLAIGRKLDLPPLATNDSHYVTADQSNDHAALLCVQSQKTLSDPTRFQFEGDGYYIKSPDEMRAYWDKEMPGAADNTLIVAERVEPYDEMFAFVDRMPRFPIPGDALVTEAERMLGGRVVDVSRGVTMSTLIIRVNTDASPETITALRDPLAAQPGRTPVVMVLHQGDQDVTTVQLTEYPVDLSTNGATLLRTLKAIPGVTIP